jgi:ketosteroid isomerase-like protein
VRQVERLGQRGTLEPATLEARGARISKRNVEIVRRFLVDDFDEALMYVDPGIVWNPVEESAAQGHDAVRASTARWKSEWDDYELIPEEFADAGDRVVATVRFRARGRGSGIEVDARLYDVFTLRDGKIVRMDQFTEQSEALEAVGLRE